MEQSNVQRAVRIAGVVVLYQSPRSTIEAIKTYVHQVETLYLIDNSPVAVDWVAEFALIKPGAIRYQQLATNPGIATALNTAAQLAIADQFDYLLTMDDDSKAPADLIQQMRTYLSRTNSDRIGILTPRHLLTTTSETDVPDPTEARPVLTTMTSGNLLNLSIYQQVGPFLESLFIDVVDHEYYLRLRQHGYQIMELPWLWLTHRLGLQKRRFGLNFVSHSPLRNYYLVRNSLYVANHYRRTEPGYWVFAMRIVGLETIKAMLLEDKPLARLRYIGRGLADGIRGRLGKAT